MISSPVSGQMLERTRSRKTHSRNTPSQIDTIPEHNHEWIPSQMDTISNKHDPEWTPSRIGTIPNGLDTIPNGHNPEWTPSRMEPTPN